jgi:hypothetical protein
MYMNPRAKREQRLYVNLFCDLAKCDYREPNGKKMVSAPEEEILQYLAMLQQKPIYRITIHDDTTVTTDCYDLLENFAPELNLSYDSVDDLPSWAQDKLAVLMLFDHTKQNAEVENVGRRINKNIFWVFKGEGDGDYPRG